MWEKIKTGFFLGVTLIMAIIIFYFFRKSDTLDEEVRALRREKLKEKIYDIHNKLDKQDEEYAAKRDAYLKLRNKYTTDLNNHSTKSGGTEGDAGDV
jgi:ABC-type transporter lipoprotein component MlaA